MKLTHILAAFTAMALAGAAFAVDSKDYKPGGCCDKAAKAGKKCEHSCCVDAEKEGKVCEKCNGKKK